MENKRYTPYNKTREELIKIFEAHPFANNSELGDMLNVSRERISNLRNNLV